MPDRVMLEEVALKSLDPTQLPSKASDSILEKGGLPKPLPSTWYNVGKDLVVMRESLQSDLGQLREKMPYGQAVQAHLNASVAAPGMASTPTYGEKLGTELVAIGQKVGEKLADMRAKMPYNEAVLAQLNGLPVTVSLQEKKPAEAEEKNVAYPNILGLNFFNKPLTPFALKIQEMVDARERKVVDATRGKIESAESERPYGQLVDEKFFGKGMGGVGEGENFFSKKSFPLPPKT